MTMIRRSSSVLHLIDELTTALAASPVEQAQRRLRYALALLHAAVESLDELDATSVVARAAGGTGQRASAG
jgi:hypothetical protein